MRLIRPFVITVAFLAILASTATAQDHWATKGECEVAAWNPYDPSTTSNKPLDAAKEVILPHPTGGCGLLQVPDRITKGFPMPGRAWVQVAKGTPVVFSKVEDDTRGMPLRLAKCDNYFHDFAPFGDGRVSPNPLQHVENTVVPAPALVLPDSRLGSGGTSNGLVLPVQNADSRSTRKNNDQSFLERHWKKSAGVGAALIGLWCVLECRTIENTNIQNNGVPPRR